MNLLHFGKDVDDKLTKLIWLMVTTDLSYLYFISVFVFFPLYSFAGWTVFHQTSERVTYKSSSKPRTRFLSGPVSLSICLYLFFCILSQPIFLLSPFFKTHFHIYLNMFSRIVPFFLNNPFYFLPFLKLIIIGTPCFLNFVCFIESFCALLLAHAWVPKACVEDLIIYSIPL